MSRYGKWDDFCRDSGNGHATIPVCNLFEQARARGGQAPYFGGCELEGISLGGDRHLANLGTRGMAPQVEGGTVLMLA